MLRTVLLAGSIVGLLIPIVVAQSPSSQESRVCPAGLRLMDGVGLVCPREHLYEVYTPDLVSLGFIHGTDPIPAASELPGPNTVMAGASPNCVAGAAGTYFIQVIYARATNDADQYAALRDQIRWLVGQANKLVDDAALATGSSASLNVKCVSGQVEVKNEALPTAKASASFSTIVTDLRAKGYNDGKVKYWVFYDDTGACSCAGTGHLYSDETLAASNLNNGNGVSMYAVDFGYNSTRTMLHELAHNMGAVQNGAPHSSLAGHCYDGRDTMCYADGGGNSSLYSTSYCAVEVFDCGKTDYFHASPPPASYLATKWNLGSSLNRYITFPSGPIAPTATSLTCSPSPVETDATVTCSFVATDPDSSGVKYAISWGDASSSTVPSSGYVPPDVAQVATHAYTAAGSKTVSVTATDNSGLVSNTRTATVSVFADPPVMNLLTCPTIVEVASTATCSMRAADNSSGVRYTVLWGDATSALIPSSGSVTPGVTRTSTHAWPTPAIYTVTATATDDLGHTSAIRTTSVTVSNDITPPTVTIVDPAPNSIYRGCATKQTLPVSPITWIGAGCVRASISDAGSGVARMDVFVGGVFVGSDSTAPYELDVPVAKTGSSVSVRVDAYDNAGNSASATVFVVVAVET